MKIIKRVGAAALCLSLIFAFAAILGAGSAADERWIGSWGTPAIESGVSLFDSSDSARLHLTDIIPANSTVRSVLKATAGGSKVRFKFSNLFGSSPLTINAATVAKSIGNGNIDPSTAKNITWNTGDTYVTIPAGQEILSDEIDFPISNLEEIAVSTFYDKMTRITTQGMYGCNTYLTSSLGNRTRSEQMGLAASLLTFTSNTISYHVTPFLTRMDVLSNGGYSVVLIGDSTITNDVYLCLEEKLMNAGINNVGVVMSGIVGNKILRDGTGILATVYGQSLMSRFKRDALDVPGSDYIIIKEGVNDIIHPYSKTMKLDKVKATDLVTGMYQLANSARAMGKVVSVCEISPYKGYERNFAGIKDMEWNQDAHNTILEVNNLLRYSYSSYFNYLINLDSLIDPNDPTKIQGKLTVDGAHLSKAGQVAMTDLIPEGAYGIGGNIRDLADIRQMNPYDRSVVNDSSSSGNSVAGFLPSISLPGVSSGSSSSDSSSGSSSSGDSESGGVWEGIKSAINTFIPGNSQSSGSSSSSGAGDIVRRTIDGISSGISGIAGGDGASSSSAEPGTGLANQSPNVITPIDGAANVSSNAPAAAAAAAPVLVATDNNAAAGATVSEGVTGISQTQRLGMLIIASCIAALLLLTMLVILRTKSQSLTVSRASSGSGRRYRTSDREV